VYKHADFQSFKGLRQVSLDFSKINILVGPNNSGKSSVLQALILLKQSFRSGQPYVAYNGPYIDLGSFRDVVFGRSAPSFRVGFGVFPFTLEAGNNPPNQTLGYYVEVRANGLSQQVALDDGLAFEINQQGKVEWRPFGPGDISAGTPMRVADWQLYGTPSDLYKDTIAIQQLIQEKLNNIFLVGPVRGLTQTRTGIDPNLSSEIGVKGEHLVSVLHYVQGDSDYVAQFEKIRFWAEKFGLGGLVARLIQGPSSTISYVDRTNQVTVDLANSGFGANQLLPVIAQCFLAPKGSLVMIEEPEAHLHPAYQAQLFDFFMDVAAYGNQVLITTHSEHLILRLQRRLAEQKLSPNDVALYAMDRTPQGAITTRVSVDKEGLFDKIPAGFFEAGFKESLEHMKAASKLLEKTKHA
jgi:energy-coupling factor transporter ATP-binding protein EcfA2